MRSLSMFQALVISASLMVSSISLVAQSEEGKYQNCLICHGSAGQGNSVVKAPAIAGIDDYYLHQQISNYRELQRGYDYKADPEAAEMAAVARQIDDAEVAEIAEYLTSLKGQVPAHDGVDGDITAGKASYMQVCSACHGVTAQGNDLLKAPSLVHLNDWYVVASFNKYVSGSRGGATQDSSAQQMRAIAQGLPEEFSIEDVAAYIRSINVVESN